MVLEKCGIKQVCLTTESLSIYLKDKEIYSRWKSYFNTQLERYCCIEDAELIFNSQAIDYSEALIK